MLRATTAIALCFMAARFAVLAVGLGHGTGEEKPAAERPFDDRLLEIAKTYKDYGRVDDEARWAPGLCRMPNPAVAQFSESTDDLTHGRKLYSLLARDRNAYLTAGKEKPSAVGQVIVKESWVPEEVTDLTAPREVAVDGKDRVLGDHFLPYATKDGKTYRASKPAGLYIMYKFDPKTPDTDEGWVYGTITPDGKKVTAAGKLESCMKCHQEAPYDRLFGLAPAEKPAKKKVSEK
jgi:hypothetical protein